MDDDRLINVEARDVFEWMLASYVAQGWQPGMAICFGATVKCFQWNQDRNRLLRFGELGYYLDHALVEMSSFNEQERMLADRQVFLIEGHVIRPCRIRHSLKRILPTSTTWGAVSQIGFEPRNQLD